MKKLYTFCFALLSGAGLAQVPTNFGTNAGDGVTYSVYNLIDHGAVSSVRFQAQNSVAQGNATWEFFTGDYMNNWRPYFADDTLSGFNAVIDPAVETASARYNSNYGGQTGKLQAIQAGYYYTAIVQDGSGDNLMSILETNFAPVAIDTVYHSPENPTEADAITITVELDGALALSPGEFVYVRSSIDGWATSQFSLVSSFVNGVGSFTIPGNILPAGITVQYYVLVTATQLPAHATIDYFTLFFGNNSGANYEFTVSPFIGINDHGSEFSIVQNENAVLLKNVGEYNTIDLISMDGRLVSSNPVNGQTQLSISTQSLPSGAYLLVFNGNEGRKSARIALK
jgi:hypothetical protein